MDARRYTTLDGMRGIAAVAVAAFHIGPRLQFLFPHSAYLAVDFFFLLSGFVIAHAYEHRLSAGLAVGPFLRARILRLYPLYILGTLLTVCAASIALFVKHDSSFWTPRYLEVAIPFAIFMFPLPWSPNIFPLNAPAWSLFYELVVNGAYAMRSLRKACALYTLIAISLAGLIAQVVLFGHLDQGAWWPSTLWAFFRVFFGFPMGVLLYRLHGKVRFSAPPPLLLLVLMALLYMDPIGIHRIIFDLVFVLFIAPLLVLLGAASAPRGRAMIGLYDALGFISYPLYALHFPLITIVGGLMRRYGNGTLLNSWTGLVLLAALIVVASIAGALDARLRGYLATRSRRSVPVTA